MVPPKAESQTGLTAQNLFDLHTYWPFLSHV